MRSRDVVITGIGIVSPLAIGRHGFWDAIENGRSGIGPIRSFDASSLACQIAGEVRDFDGREFVSQRKTLKLMAREAQFGVAAAVLACRDAGIVPGSLDPDRMGVVMGCDTIYTPLEEAAATYRHCISNGQFHYERWGDAGMNSIYPLTFLRVLPNMVASHVSIALDARGPNNTIFQAEISSLLAIREATRAIQRNAADCMVAGGSSSQMTPADWMRRCLFRCMSRRNDAPTAAARPFDRDRDGEVRGEGACLFVLESLDHAAARGAAPLARVLGSGASYVRERNGTAEWRGLRYAMAAAAAEAELSASQIGHVNAHGLSTPLDDMAEARVLCEMLPGVPVTAPKSYFGSLGAAGGAMELAVSALAIGRQIVPPTLNYGSPDPGCPVGVVSGSARETKLSNAIAVNTTLCGQAAAVIIAHA